jgi:hypothetical protein
MKKSPKNVAKNPLFVTINASFLSGKKDDQKIWATCVILKKTAQRKKLPNKRKFA